MMCLCFQVLYRVAMAILVLFHKHTSSTSTAGGAEWSADIQKNGIDAALTKFLKEITIPPNKVGHYLLYTSLRNF